MSLHVDDILGDSGRIAARLPQYEPRPEQLEMSRAVARAIESQSHLLVEAGTGVGKSFAYLVPAILAAAATDQPAKRVVISTHTISLQEQLIQKDLPFLNAVLPVEFSAVLVKGRSNYLSLRRLEGARDKAAALFADPDEIAELQQIQKWVDNTGDGSRADLAFRPRPQVWDEVQSEHGNCLGRRCATYGDCFYYRARRRVRNADVLVVNHALFFSDLALRREGASILPDYDVVIFDEAHTLEGVAADHLGFGISSGQLEYYLNRLFNERKRRGLLLHHNAPDALEIVQNLKQKQRTFFALVRNWQQKQGRGNGRVRAPLPIPDSCTPLLMDLCQSLGRVGDQLPEDQAIEITAAAQKAASLAAGLQQWLGQANDDAVYWIETAGRQQQNLKLVAAPIDIGPVLREELFDTTATVILTSATLSVGSEQQETNSDVEDENPMRSGFGFIRNRLGLTSGRNVRLGSPFNFREQAKLILVNGLPCPSDNSPGFEAALPAAVQKYIATTDGRAFVLFTSYRLLQHCARALQGWFVDKGLTLFSQGDGMPRSAMLERFRKEPRAVLFGTDSFWQGIDVPGDALQNVIIPKLPFSVPDHPLLEARLDAIRQRGGNPFMEYQVPEAIIKLKQGFGRLIRSRTDTGQVVLLDPRVTTRRYGHLFLDALPDCQQVRERFNRQA